MQVNTKKTFSTFIKFSKPYLGIIILIFISIVLTASLNSITPIFYKNLFNQITLLGGDRNVIAQGAIAILMTILAIKAFQWLLWRIATFAVVYYENNVITNLAAHCFQYLHQHSFTYFNNTFSGSLVKRNKSFLRAFETITDQVIFELLPLVCNVIVIFIVLYLDHPFLAFGILLWIILFMTVNWFFTKYKLKHDIARSAAETKTSGFFADTVSNHANIKLFTGFKKEVKDYQTVLNELKAKTGFVWNLNNIFEAVQGILMISLEIGIFYFAVILWRQGRFTPGDFILIQSYLITMFMYIWDFGRIIRRIYESLADAEEMTVILDTPHEIVDAPHAKKLIVKQPKIEFKNVSFAYKQGNSVIENLSLTVKSKEKLAIIGPSGAGKTTLIKLILRMHDINGGQILICDQDISKVTQDSLRSNISMVPQDPILFHRSLMENIRYGRLDATDEEVYQASKLAHCHEFISKFPEKYDTFVGERGVKLSGGERQRVAIARSILRNSPILILDEATSSLDSESEKLIQDAMVNLMKNKTVIVIAHRLSTIKMVDRIVVVDEGRIVEEGTHSELFHKDKGLYQKLWNIQLSGFNETS